MLKQINKFLKIYIDDILTFLVGLCVFSFPLVFSMYLDYGFQSFFKIYILCCLFTLFSFLVLPWDLRSLYKFTGVKFLFAILGSSFLSSIFSRHFPTSLLGSQIVERSYSFLLLFTIILSFLCFLNWLLYKSFEEKKEVFLSISLYLTAGIFISCIYGLFEIWNKRDVLTQSFRLTSTVWEANRYAFMLLVSLPYQVSLILLNKSYKKYLSILVFCLTLLCLWLTFSRASWLIGLASSLFFVFFAYKLRLIKFVIDKWLLIFCGVLLGIFLFHNSLISRSWKSLLAISNDYSNNRGSITIRLKEWSDAVSVIEDFSVKDTLFGLGPTFSKYEILSHRTWSQLTFLSENERETYAYLVRNHYLQLFLDSGILGILIWIGALFFIFRLFFLHFQDLKNEKEVSRKIILLCLYINLIIITSIGIIYYYTLFIWFVFFLSYSFILIFFSSEKKDLQINSLSRFSMIFPLSLLVIGSWYFISVLVGSYKHSPQLAFSIFPYSQGNQQDFLSTMLFKESFNQEKAFMLVDTLIRNNPYDINNISLAWKTYFFSSVWFNKPENFKISQQYSQKMAILDPDRSITSDAVGQAFLNEGDLEKAEEYFLKANQQNPSSVSPLMHLGEVFRQKGSASQSLDYYLKSLELETDPLMRSYLQNKIIELSFSQEFSK